MPPDLPTMPTVFRAAGKLHVYPQRDRIGFEDVGLFEEGRHHLGNVLDGTGDEQSHPAPRPDTSRILVLLIRRTPPTDRATGRLSRHVRRCGPADAGGG